MTVPGGYPAPGPQDHEPTRDQSYAGLPPTSAPPTGPPLGPAYLPPAPMRPIPMLSAHKPGIVPLRPLSLGDILDGAVKAVRFNPKAMVGMSAVALALFLVPSAALGIGATHLSAQALNGFGPDAEPFRTVPATAIQGVFTALATAILSGLLIYVVGQAVLGRKPDIAATWQAARGRVLSLLALLALTVLFSVLATAVLIGPGTLLLLNHNAGAGVILLVLGTLGLIAVSVYVSTKICLAAPAIVLENHRVIAGLRRSFTLTAGSVFWRILGITILAGLIAGVARWVLGLPFTIISGIVTGVSGQGSESAAMTATFLSHLSGLLTGSITTPFVAAVTGLLYIDRRMRLEALDVVLLRESQSNLPPL